MLLTERGLVGSRARAQAMVLSGMIKVNGHLATKAGMSVPGSAKIEIISGPKYVSRGGEKLEGALQDFQLKVHDLICIDVGSSTGGFTDCLLQNGAKRVYAVDVGHRQLDDTLRVDHRVVSIEDTHILSVEPGALQPQPTLAVVDVSFISLKKILERVGKIISWNGQIVAMVKPQFEVGPKHLKKGVVKSEEIATGAVTDVIKFAEAIGFVCEAQSPARIKGPKGNQEYFIFLTKKHVNL